MILKVSRHFSRSLRPVAARRPGAGPGLQTNRSQYILLLRPLAETIPAGPAYLPGGAESAVQVTWYPTPRAAVTPTADSLNISPRAQGAHYAGGQAPGPGFQVPPAGVS